MEFLSYQNQAKRTAIYPGQNSIHGIFYLALELCGESGEIANKLKKVLRDANGIITEDVQNALIDEMGDILWPLSQLCYELNTTLETVAVRNLAKLRKRQRNDTLRGNGDDR